MEMKQTGQDINTLLAKKSKLKDGNDMIVKIDNKFVYSKKYEHFWSNQAVIKFIVDIMCYKLAKYLRNIGIDTVFVSEKDYQMMIDLSIREQRIIITKDVKFFQKKKGVPTYLLSKTDSNTEDHF